jgi:hypothetical protein
MNIIRTLIITVLFLSFLSCNRQVKSNSEKQEFSDSNTLYSTEKEKSDYIDPYYNGHLCKNFNPEQIDFSKEYLELRNKWFSKEENVLSQFINYDFSSIWLTENRQQNGVLGRNYQRIQFHFSTITRSLTDSSIYFVEGKSKVNNNICNFNVEIKLIKLFVMDCEEWAEFNFKCGNVFARYTFYEDSTENHSGIFTGIVESCVYVDNIKKAVLLDESFDGADGYWNNTFVGIWTNYKTKQSKKCIWGDYRLPFTFDFDCGDGEMIVCDEYVKNGWQTYNNGSEYIQVNNDKWELKDKWWKK